MSELWQKFESEVTELTPHVPAERFDYSVNISLKHCFVYVETPKVACSTIKATLQRLELDKSDLYWSDVEELHNRDLSPLLRPSQVHGFKQLLAANEFFVFCFVRNPYERLLSAYLDKIRRGHRSKRQILRSLGGDLSDRHVSFGEFVSVVCSLNLSKMNAHWLPQVIQTCQQAIDYDFIGRFENFRADFESVLGRFCPDSTKIWCDETRHRTRSSNLVDQYYTSELRKQVYEKYREDFTTFGYSA